jgi:hypothetical protein
MRPLTRESRIIFLINKSQTRLPIHMSQEPTTPQPLPQIRSVTSEIQF